MGDLQLPPISWGVVIIVVTNAFYFGVQVMRLRALEKMIEKHVDDDKIHTLDAPTERKTLVRHDRILSRIAPQDFQE